MWKKSIFDIILVLTDIKSQKLLHVNLHIFWTKNAEDVRLEPKDAQLSAFDSQRRNLDSDCIIRSYARIPQSAVK